MDIHKRERMNLQHSTIKKKKSNHKGREIEETSYKAARKQQNGNAKFMPIITLNVNELNIPVKRHRVAE